ncbi:MAG: hypothetical protein ACI4U3_03130 [Traorella sp.]
MKKHIGFIGIIVLILINVLLFKIILDKKLDLVEVPVAAVLIEPRTQISEDMIEVIKIPRAMINEDCVLDKEEAIHKYTEIEGMIPKGSLLYKSMLFDEDELPDYPALKLKQGQNVYSLATDLIKSSGNSLTNNQLVDIYVTFTSKKENPISDCLLMSVRIINVVDRKGIDMKKSELNIPSVINLAVNEEYVSLLKKASEMGSIDLYATTFPQEEECILNSESAVLPKLYE